MLKRFAWFLFKSPQRRQVGWQTLWTDLEGAISLIARRLFAKKNKEIIWICVGNKNRSEALLRFLIQSAVAAKRSDRIAFSIVDCTSDDTPDLEKSIREIWKGELIYTRTDRLFTRSGIFNMAMEQAKGERLFVCDADMTLPENIVGFIDKNTSAKTAWFPVCQWQLDEQSAAWKWFTAGTGIFSARKNVLQEIGYYNEEIVAWGKEDWDLFFRFYSAGIMPFRSRCKGLYHHWHVSAKPENYENMF